MRTTHKFHNQLTDEDGGLGAVQLGQCFNGADFGFVQRKVDALLADVGGVGVHGGISFSGHGNGNGGLLGLALSQLGPNNMPVSRAKALARDTAFAVFFERCGQLVVTGLAPVTHVFDVAERETALGSKRVALCFAQLGEIGFKFFHVRITSNDVVLVNTI